jgi:hypothetical protein
MIPSQDAEKLSFFFSGLAQGSFLLLGISAGFILLLGLAQGSFLLLGISAGLQPCEQPNELSGFSPGPSLPSAIEAVSRPPSSHLKPMSTQWTCK